MMKLNRMLRRFADHQQGYALVVVVLLFTAFAAVSVAYMDRNTVQQKIDRAASTRAELTRLSNAIVQAYYFNATTQYRYPCPAAYNVLPTGSAFGSEVTGCQSGTPGGIDVLSGGEMIRGMVPVRALAAYGIDNTEAFDSWGNRIMYVVNRQLTTSGSGTGSSYPTLKDLTTNTTLAAPDFMLISYGPDHLGAITRNSTTVGFTCTGSTTREENCNGDLNFYTSSSNTPSTATSSTYFDDIVSSVTHSSIPYQACANGATNPPTCDTCSDGLGLTTVRTGSCGAGYTGDSYTTQNQTRTSCSAGWTDSGSPNTSHCTATTCANGANNPPTCTFAYACTDTYCVNGACNAPQQIQSNTDITGTTGTPNGPAGGDIVSCNGNSNGACANTANTCMAGNPTGYNANYTGSSCGGTPTWTCAGDGSGSSVACTGADNTPCTSCSNTAISGYDSGTGWHGPVQTPTYNICSAVTTAGQAFAITTDTAGSSWHAETHTWTFVRGTVVTETYTPYDSKSKSTTVNVIYDGGCNIYATASFTRNNGSDYQWVRVQLTAINGCVTSGGGSGGGGGSYGGHGCFLGTTLVTMADGSEKPISDLKKGDTVQGKTSVNEVIVPATHQSDEPMYGFNGGAPFVTGEHMLMTTRGWRCISPSLALKESHGTHHVAQLKIGDQLLLHGGGSMKVKSIDAHHLGKVLTLYNPGLDGDHTYYANGILVHNLKPVPGESVYDN